MTPVQQVEYFVLIFVLTVLALTLYHAAFGWPTEPRKGIGHEPGPITATHQAEVQP